MTTQLWIEIPNWERFQHYRDRDPRWIKVYTALHHDENFLSLTGHQRAVLLGLWLEYASSRSQLAVSTSSLSSRLRLRVTTETLRALNHAGFIHMSASKPLAQRQRQKSVASQQTEQSGASALPLNQGGKNPLADRLLAEIRDANHRTAQVVRGFQRRLPDAAFAAALESLRHRRAKRGAPLTSEARYVVATLNTMAREEQYRRL